MKEEGGKKVLNKKNSALFAILILTIGIVKSLYPVLFGTEAQESSMRTSDAPIVKTNGSGILSPSKNTAPLGGIAEHAPEEVRPKGRGQRLVIRYKGKQVIGPGEEMTKIPRGANFIGKLMTSIDTRSPGMVQVVLPYGGSHKSGGSIPLDTILFGEVNYPGQGEKIYINFNRGVTPDGEELNLRGQALSSKDYSLGIIGSFHGNTSERIASVLGLSMVGGISEVLVEKEALGQGYTTTPKPSLKNGFYNGVAKVTESEAQTQASKLAKTPEYATVDAGSDVIVSLTESLRQGERRE